MATKKKLLQAAAGSAGGAGGLDVSEVFSTYLYEGNGSTQTITNDIDLSGEGGLVWMQVRNVAGGNRLVDSENGNNYLRTHSTSNLTSIGSPAFTLNSNGFTVPNGATAWNESGNDYASWTFRKAPKFFDVVTYTGTGSTQNISHNLGTTVGAIFVKRTDSTTNWIVYHRGNTSAPHTDHLKLNLTDATQDAVSSWNDTAPTSTEFTVGSSNDVNRNGNTYVAYLFAHNNGDGDFGPTGDQDIIKCGSYTPDGSGNATINLGFEPQFLLIKCSSASGTYRGWAMFDAMRGVPTGSNTSLIEANLSAAEKQWFPNPRFTPTGFETTSADQADAVNTGGQTYIYIAIRRGPMAVPESATDVFAIDTAGGTSPTPPTFVSGFPVDFSFYKNKTDSVNNWGSQNRLTGYGDLAFNATSAEYSNSGSYWQKDYMNGIGSNTGTNSNGYQWMFRRAPNYFDVVAYTGNGTAGRSVPHNLGVVPEMMWVKRRDIADSWNVYHTGLDATAPETKYIRLNSTSGVGTNSDRWNDTAPTATGFVVSGDTTTNGSGSTYIAYLFASVDGVSKVGSYTGNGTNQNIDCGFSSGARFVLIKAASTSGQWAVWDTERGIVAGDDSTLYLDSTVAADTDLDFIDPYSSGFNITNLLGNYNASGVTYIFYAVA